MAKAIAKKKITLEAYETALKGYVSNDNQACTLAAKRDKAVEALDNKYNPQFLEIKGKMDADFAVIQQYCEENREAMFVGGKSIETNGVKVGFKDGKPKVEILEPIEGYDAERVKELWEAALGLVKVKLPDYVRTVEEISKAKLIEDREQPAVIRGLVKCGLCIVQDETFFIKVTKTKKK